MTLTIRIALAILFLNELIVGAWNQFFPRSFYDTFPTVDLTPPFSEHYARDFGGATLGIAVLLGIALVTAKASWILPATIAYTVFSIPHFVFHAAHLEHTTPGEAVFLLIGNAVVALLGLLALALTLLRDRLSPRSAPERSRATPR